MTEEPQAIIIGTWVLNPQLLYSDFWRRTLQLTDQLVDIPSHVHPPKESRISCGDLWLRHHLTLITNEAPASCMRWLDSSDDNFSCFRRP